MSPGLTLLGLISWPSVLVSFPARWVGKPRGKMGSCPVPSEQSWELKSRCGGFRQFLLPPRLDSLLLAGGWLVISFNRAVFILNDQKLFQKRVFPLVLKKHISVILVYVPLFLLNQDRSTKCAQPSPAAGAVSHLLSAPRPTPFCSFNQGLFRFVFLQKLLKMPPVLSLPFQLLISRDVVCLLCVRTLLRA